MRESQYQWDDRGHGVHIMTEALPGVFVVLMPLHDGDGGDAIVVRGYPLNPYSKVHFSVAKTWRVPRGLAGIGGLVDAAAIDAVVAEVAQVAAEHEAGRWALEQARRRNPGEILEVAHV